MTNNICDTLNLPRLEDALKEVGVDPGKVQESSKEVEEMAKVLEQIVPSNSLVDDETGIKKFEEEMNEIYHLALKAHKELADLGYNVEARHAGSIFEPAARFLETAMTASKNKNEQKLKLIKLRMDREKLDADLKKNVQEGEIQTENGESGFLANRNDLLKDLRERLKKEHL
jgi:hypothetical protein